MSRTSELSLLIDELTRNGEALIGVAQSLRELFSNDKVSQADTTTSGTQAEEAEVPALTLEQVRAVLAEKSRSGHTAEVRELLLKHGAAKLSEIDPVDYKALLAEAEVLA